jgi:hypothetical protein
LGTFSTFTGIPTGTVIVVTASSPGTLDIDMCATNSGTGVPSGTNDSYVSLLDNTYLSTGATIDDGCTNMAAPGFGPSVGQIQIPAAGTYYLYVTEYDAAGTDACIADGANSAYMMDITSTLAVLPTNDECATPILLPVVSGTGNCSSTVYSSQFATESAPADSCAGFLGNADDDLFFSFVATASAVQVQLQGSANYDGVILGYDACGGTALACSDTTIGGDLEEMTMSGLSVGTTYYVRVYNYGTGGGDFTLCFYTLPANDLTVLAGTTGQYTIIPSFEMPSAGLPVSAVIKNSGSAAQTSVVVTADVFLIPNLTPVQTLSAAPVALAAGATATFNLGSFTQTAVGDYQIIYSVGLVGDANQADNTLSSMQEVSNQKFARDNGENTDGLGLATANATVWQGAKFDLISAAQVLSMDYYLFGANPARVGTVVEGFIFDLDANGMPQNLVLTSPAYTLTAADTADMNIVFSPTLTLTPGTYLIGLKSLSVAGANVALGFSPSVFTPLACMVNSDSLGGTWAEVESYGFDIAYSIRPNLKLSVGIEAGNVESFDMMPNPASDNVNIAYTLKKEGNVSIEIMDISGRVVSSIQEKTAAASHNIDLTALASGVYMVRFTLDGQSTFHKLSVN